MSEKVPSFDAIALSEETMNRVYRVLILPDELAFVWVGPAGELSLLLRGLGLFGWAAGVVVNPDRRNAARRRQIEETPLARLIADHEYNFRVKADDLRSASIDPVYFGQGFYWLTPNLKAFFLMKSRFGSELRMALTDNEAVALAIDQLPAVLGDTLSINAHWDPERQRYVPARA